FARAAHLDKEYAPAHFWRGAALEGLQRLGDAQLHYRRALKLDPTYVKQLKTRTKRVLLVANDTHETLRVWVRYESRTTDGVWHWYPEEPVHWDVPAGDMTNLVDIDDYKVQGRRVRVWAVGLSTGRVEVSYRNRDLWLCPEEGYLSRE